MSIIGSGVATEIARSLSGIDVHIVRDPAGLSQSAIKRKSKFDRIKNRGTLSKIRGAPEWDDEHRQDHKNEAKKGESHGRWRQYRDRIDHVSRPVLGSAAVRVLFFTVNRFGGFQFS
jgi:hypothetical protein